VPPSGRVSGRTSADRPSDSGYGSVSSRRSEDRRRPSESDSIPVGRRSEESFRRMEDAYAVGRTSEDSYTPGVAASRRRPSQDTARRSEDRERERDYARRPSGAVSLSGTSDSASTANPAQSTTATSAMIIPNKSTIEEEYIEVPYGRDARESGSTTIDERERSRDASRDAGRLGDGEIDSASDYPSPLSPRSPPAGLSGLSARLKGVENEDDERDIPGAGGRSSDDYYDKYGRSSVNSDHSVASGVGARSRAGASEDQEKLRRDYEFRIATMQTQITSLQRDLGDAGDRERKLKEGEARVRQMEEELMILRRVSLCSLVYCVFLNRVLCYVQRAEEESMAMRALQGELDELRAVRQREKEREALRAREDDDELRILRDRCERLEEERQHRQGEVSNIVSLSP